jgi:hypothetical protein
VVERSIGILNIQFVGPNAGQLASYFDGLREGAPKSFGDVLSKYGGGDTRNIMSVARLRTSRGYLAILAPIPTQKLL